MKALFALTLLATLGFCAVAQESKISLTARDNPQAVSAQPDGKQTPSRTSSDLPFCPKKTCLYYAGDFDSAWSGANGFLNGKFDDGSVFAQAQVGVKPPKAAVVTGVTFNQFFTSGFVGTNPTPFQATVGIVDGSEGGTPVCNTWGNATMVPYGESDFGYVQYSYNVKKLAQPCKIPRPTKKYPSTYIDLIPTGDGYGYVANTKPNPKNHRGWKNDLNDCFGILWGAGAYVPCNSQGDFPEFSIALTGKETK